MTASSQSFQLSKSAGDEAVRRSDFEAAEHDYSAALEHSEISSSVRAAVFCNRAFVRLQREDWAGAEEDASSTLAEKPEEKLRVKALFRRGLAREALGLLEAADIDLNLAVKAAPTNEGIVAAARRVRESLPPKPRAAWVPVQPYHTPAVQSLAEAIPGAVRGYMQTQEHVCVRFPNHVGVQAHERTGGLVSIRQALGAPQRAPKGKEVPTRDRDFAQSPNFDLEDGLSVEYDVGGNLTKIYTKFAEDFSGPYLTYNADGSLSLRETAVYKDGRISSKLESDIPAGFVACALQMLVVPVKKAIGMGLAPNEEELCFQHGVNPSVVGAAELSTARPDGETRLPSFAAPVPPQPKDSRKRVPTGKFEPSDRFQGARENWVFKLGDQGLGYYEEVVATEHGPSWEALLNVEPQGVGPAWVGPFGKAKTEPPEMQAPKPKQTPSHSFSRPAFPSHDASRLQGMWAYKSSAAPVGQIQGDCIVWHRSFRSRPTKLKVTGDRVVMDMEGKTHSALFEPGPPTCLKWDDGEEWIRMSLSPGAGYAGS